MFADPLVWGAVGLSAALQLLVVQAPVLNEGFGTTPLAAADWATCLAAASSVLWVDELRKILRRRPEARHPGRPNPRASLEPPRP
jgi:magnesium-transporting ATPase (P-type)